MKSPLLISVFLILLTVLWNPFLPAETAFHGARFFLLPAVYFSAVTFLTSRATILLSLAVGFLWDLQNVMQPLPQEASEIIGVSNPPQLFGLSIFLFAIVAAGFRKLAKQRYLRNTKLSVIWAFMGMMLFLFLEVSLRALFSEELIPEFRVLKFIFFSSVISTVFMIPLCGLFILTTTKRRNPYRSTDRPSEQLTPS